MKTGITKEQYLKLLDTVFPWGYIGDTDDWEKDWFLGWGFINDGSLGSDVMCVRLIGKTLQFELIDKSVVSFSEASYSIAAMMHALLPEWETSDSFKAGSRFMNFTQRDNDGTSVRKYGCAVHDSRKEAS